MTARSRAANAQPEPVTVTLYVVTAKAVPYIEHGAGEPVDRLLFTGDIVPADMPADQIAHLLKVGLIQGHDVPIQHTAN